MMGPQWIAAICISACLIASSYRPNAMLRSPTLRCYDQSLLTRNSRHKSYWRGTTEDVTQVTSRVQTISSIVIIQIFSMFFNIHDSLATSDAGANRIAFDTVANAIPPVTADTDSAYRLLIDNDDQRMIDNDRKNRVSLKSESEEVEVGFDNFQLAREPKTATKGSSVRRSLNPLSKKDGQISSKDIDLAAEKVLTLKAYLDEAERDLFEKHWDNVKVYLFTFSEQEDSFAILIDNLFPNDDELDKTAREAMSFEAKSMYLAVDDLMDAAKDERFETAHNAYAKLLLSYDRFLKAGNLYPTYDVITSTEIFYADIPKDELKFDSTSKVEVQDKAVLTSGPDMGKTCTVIYIDGDKAVVKLDKDGKAYQEVKYVNYKSLAKADAGTSTSRSGS